MLVSVGWAVQSVVPALSVGALAQLGPIEKIDADFYARSVRTIGDAVVALDKADAALAEARATARPTPIKAGMLETVTGLGKLPVIGIAALLGLSLGLGLRFLLRKRGTVRPQALLPIVAESVV